MSNTAKLSTATFLGILSAYWGIAALPLIFLFILMLVDYGTGICAAWMTGTLSSRKSVLGILKKVGYLAVIVVGIACDFLIEYAFSAIGQDVSVSFAVGLVIIVWLILNECISILENLATMGVPFPKFLKGIVKHLKVVTEETSTKNINNTDIESEDNK